jgi:hypothetical protein
MVRKQWHGNVNKYAPCTPTFGLLLIDDASSSLGADGIRTPSPVLSFPRMVPVGVAKFSIKSTTNLSWFPLSSKDSLDAVEGKSSTFAGPP